MPDAAPTAADATKDRKASRQSVENLLSVTKGLGVKVYYDRTGQSTNIDAGVSDQVLGCYDFEHDDLPGFYLRKYKTNNMMVAVLDGKLIDTIPCGSSPAEAVAVGYIAAMLKLGQ